MDYTSDIVVGNKYRDEQTGMEGVAVSIEFHQHMCERVVLEVYKDGDLKLWIMDAVRLEPVGEQKPYVQPRTGGAPAQKHTHRR